MGVVPVLKRNLNEATPKDEYPMSMSYMLVDGAAQNQICHSWMEMQATTK